jgi:hypothetical protein
MSNLQNFVRQVARMRVAQKARDKNLTRSYIERAKILEREVDKALEEMGFQGQKIKQMRLDDADPKKTDEDSGPYRLI